MCVKMKAIICTAGEGKRLRPLTKDRPKSLIKVGDKTILEYMLDNISECGIKEVILIVGYNADVVRDKIGEKYKNCKIKYYVNIDYSKTDNMFSLWMARSEIEDGIIFFNADIIFHINILKELLNSPYPNAIAVDDKIEIVDDSMKVKIEEGKVKAISKKVTGANGWAMGIYKFSSEGAKNYYKEVAGLVNSGAPDASFVKPVELVSQYSDVYVVSTRGWPWVEIDNFEDFEDAKKRINLILKNDN